MPVDVYLREEPPSSREFRKVGWLNIAHELIVGRTLYTVFYEPDGFISPEGEELTFRHHPKATRIEFPVAILRDERGRQVLGVVVDLKKYEEIFDLPRFNPL